jgi:hypothetical protein
MPDTDAAMSTVMVAAVAIAKTVAVAPTSRQMHPINIAVGGLMERNTTADAAPNPVSKKIITPPHSSFRDPINCEKMDGPSDR